MIVPVVPSMKERRKCGAGGGSRTHTGRKALRIFMPSAAFAAPTKGYERLVKFGVWTIPSPSPG